jgi:DNA polymerase-3 subunit alpha
MSGHPLDNYRFELKFYNITPLNAFNEFKDSISTFANPAKSFRLAGLVIDAQHRISKTGKNFGILTIEDYSGKSEFMLWSEDYVRYTNYLEKGTIIMIDGAFKPRYNSDQFFFNIFKIQLLEMVKSNSTRQLNVIIEPQFITRDFVDFVDTNIRDHPGTTRLKITVADKRQNIRFGMNTLEKGFTMNDEMAVYLLNNPDLEVNVVTA